MSKRLYTLFMMLLLAAFIVACGGTEEASPTVAPTDVPPTAEVVPTDAPTEEPTDAPTEEPTDARTEEPVEEPTESAEDTGEKLVVWADDTRAPILLELGEAFQAEYGVALDVQQVADINDQFPIAAPAGEGPDILIGAHDRIGGFIASGLLAPVDLGDKADSFTEGSLLGFTYEGQLYGMPYASENMAFFYNADLVSEVPATWDDVIAAGKALMDEGKVEYALALTGTTYDMFPLQTSFGGYVFGRDADGNYDPSDVGIDSEGMVAAGEWVAEQVEAGTISNSTDWDAAHQLFEQGKVPFLMAGPWALDRFRESGVNYAITNFPEGTQAGQPFAGIQGFMVNALSDKALLAQAFLTEFVATEEVMTKLYQAGSRPSAFVSVLEATEDADLAAFGAAGSDAVLMPAIPEMGSVWASWGDAFTLIVNGDQTAGDALATAGTQIRELIGGAAKGMVNIPGSHQDEIGCAADWDPACKESALTDNGDGTYSGTFSIVAGEYEAKVALDGAWTENYGLDGKKDGDNIAYTLDADSDVTFTWDSESKLLTIEPVAAGEEEGEEDAAVVAPAEDTGEKLVVWADDTRAPILLELGEAFEAEYGVALDVQQVADINDQFPIAAPAGEGPDILIGAHDRIGGFIASGLLAPVDLGDKAESFTEGSLLGFTYEGELYGMPYASENMAFFYNTDLVSEVPATWDDVIAVGKALMDEGKAEYALALTGTTYDMFPLQTSFGGYVFGRDADGNYDPSDVGIDSEGMVAAGEWVAEQVEAGTISNSTDWDAAHQLFEQGKIPFLMAGPWALDRLRESGVNYAITNFPEGTEAGQPFAGIQGFMVNALSDKALLAQAFLTEFVATEEVMTKLYQAGSRPSAFVSVLEATEDEDLAAFGAAGADAVLMPAIPEMGSVWTSWGDAFALIINGDQAAGDALATAGTQIRDLISGAAEE